MYETLALQTDGRGVATLTLNRPEKHNALSAQMMDELQAAAETLGADQAVRVVLLRGAGRSFCAGGDLAWMRAQIDMDADTRRTEARRLANMLGVLNQLPKPLIGVIEGNAFGGGVGLACVCDVAIAINSATFGLTETRLGLIPATIGPYVIARMGEGRARRVFMSARLFKAAEAVDLGIIARRVAPDMLSAEVEAEVAPYLACAPGAVAAAKRLARALGPSIGQAEINLSIEALVAQWDHPEAAKGIAAFFDKRSPSWSR
ncbi:MAG: crotonase/enoyl-CoA hydratase family protein [Pseudomonadota bacterium]